MRTIRKRPEPPSFTEYRLSAGASYDNLPHKGELRHALVSEQRGICCYCMAGIQPTRNSMRVEHWHAQATHPDEQLHYSNLLAACRGDEGTVHSHCDVSKGNRELSRNPANADHHVEDLIWFSGD